MTPEKIERDRTAGTPGPWRVGPVDDTVVIAPDGSEVAAIDGDYNEPDLWPVMEANARRIARLPELEQAYLDLTAERDAALAGAPDATAALIAAAYEVAASEAEEHEHFAKGFECVGSCIRALTPANAVAAQAARDRRMRAEGAKAAEARIERLVENLISAAASLAAAISLLERSGMAVKKAAPSNRMFDQMLIDYRATLESARAALRENGD